MRGVGGKKKGMITLEGSVLKRMADEREEGVGDF